MWHIEKSMAYCLNGGKTMYKIIFYEKHESKPISKTKAVKRGKELKRIYGDENVEIVRVVDLDDR